ncbi:diguanylate cyclase [Roseateles sp.]|uniref:diguanylate cyclase n=1 Tax=Roseateles sp. TaxID=1971397 RepID=UPI0037C75D75
MSTALEFFATDEAVAELEAELLSASGPTRLHALVSVAWQMRQRDTKRALELCDEAEVCLASDSCAALSDGIRRAIQARMMLIRGEAKWLFDELDAGVVLAESALREFTACGDDIGCADAHGLRAYLAHGQGDLARRAAEWESVISCAEGNDAVRHTSAQARKAAFGAFHDVAAARQKCAAHFAAERFAMHPAAACHAEFFLSTSAVLSGEFVEAIRHGGFCHALAIETGQTRAALITAHNIGYAFNSLNDHQAALEWMQRGLELARRSAWPSSIGMALMQTADTLRLLRRHDVARELLREALELMAKVPASYNYAVALCNLGKVELSLENYAEALATFQMLEQRSLALGPEGLLSFSLRGQAQAFLQLKEPQGALGQAHAALAAAKSNPSLRIEALQVLAEIHASHDLPNPTGMHAASAALHYLQLALDAAANIETYTVPGDLLEATAREHARIGDHVNAYELALQASQARKKIHTQEASNRASALQVSHEIDKARAEGEHQRQLALAQAERADTLERANATLEKLGKVGRDITGNLNAEAIFRALDTQLRSLLDATAFIIYRLEVDDLSLKMLFGVEDGQAVPQHIARLDDPISKVARSARERHDTIVDVAPGHEILVPGTQAPLSVMLSPLVVGERLLGLMVIQSRKAQAYAERELAIFRTLCAYGAIALANAETQGLLMEQNNLLAKLSTSDKLTGLYNRLRLDQALVEQARLTQRTHAATSIILLDVDHFKAVNDTHGHQVGDQVLVALAGLLKGQTRGGDVVGRWGGEEFLIVCRDTTLEGTYVLAEKLRSAIAAFVFPVVVRMTASFGVSTLNGSLDIDGLIARADAALYRAKRLGRNRVEIES